MDEFEKHIRKNKSLFDDHKADKAKIWEAISKGLNDVEPKVIPIWKSNKMRIAASILIIIGIFGILNFGIFNIKNSMASFENQELQEIDMHYKSLVAFQVQLIEQNSKLSNIDKKDFLSFMVELDKEYEDLKLELNKNLDNELVLEAIISNYKKRIELIENLLKQINNSKKIESNDAYIL
jgi:hypothetical protein